MKRVWSAFVFTHGLGALIAVGILMLATACSPVAPSIEKRALNGIPKEIKLPEPPPASLNVPAEELAIDLTVISSKEYSKLKPKLSGVLELAEKIVAVFNKNGTVGITLPEKERPKEAYVVTTVEFEEILAAASLAADIPLQPSDVLPLKAVLKSSTKKDDSSLELQSHFLTITAPEALEKDLASAFSSELRKQIKKISFVF